MTNPHIITLRRQDPQFREITSLFDHFIPDGMPLIWLFSPNDETEIVAEINRLSPDFIWIGLGTPKEQDWIHPPQAAIQRRVFFTVGVAFDFNAGLKKDAPQWMKRWGLTWVFRAFSEPAAAPPALRSLQSAFPLLSRQGCTYLTSSLTNRALPSSSSSSSSSCTPGP